MGRTIVVDDYPVVLHGLRSLLAPVGFDVVCEAGGDRGRQDLDPDIVVLGLHVGDVEPGDRVAEVRARYPGSRLLVFSESGSTALVRSAFALGADGFLLQTARQEHIVAALQVLAEGRMYVEPALGAQIGSDTQLNEPEPQLDDRERLTIRLVALGYTSRDIATELHLAPTTVKSQRLRLMRKLGVRNSAELVRYAFEHGFVSS